MHCLQIKVWRGFNCLIMLKELSWKMKVNYSVKHQGRSIINDMRLMDLDFMYHNDDKVIAKKEVMGPL